MDKNLYKKLLITMTMIWLGFAGFGAIYLYSTHVMAQTVKEAGSYYNFIILADEIAQEQHAMSHEAEAVINNKKQQLNFKILQLEKKQSLFFKVLLMALAIYGLILVVLHTLLIRSRFMSALAQKSEPFKAGFIAHMSHEIRTPLTAISGISEIMEQHKEQLPQRLQPLVSTLYSSSLALKKIINDIVDFSKSQTPEARIQTHYLSKKTLEKTQKRTTSKKSVLVAEDYNGNIVILSYLLNEIGVSFDVVKTGLEAIKQWQICSYDLILMDVQMPQMDGLSATRAIRLMEAQKGLQRIPIIGMSAHALVGDKDKCLQSGMSSYLTKPFEKAEFKATLQAYLEPMTHKNILMNLG